MAHLKKKPPENLNVEFDMFNVGLVFCLVEVLGSWGSGRKEAYPQHDLQFTLGQGEFY